MDQVDRLNSKPTHANIRYPSGRESIVSVRDLTICPETELSPESSMMEPNKCPSVVPIQKEETTSNEDVTGVNS